MASGRQTKRGLPNSLLFQRSDVLNDSIYLLFGVTDSCTGLPAVVVAAGISVNGGPTLSLAAASSGIKLCTSGNYPSGSSFVLTVVVGTATATISGNTTDVPAAQCPP